MAISGRKRRAAWQLVSAAVEIALLSEAHGQAAVGLGEVGFELECLPEAGDRLVDSP